MKATIDLSSLSAEVLMGQVVDEFLDRVNRGEQLDVESYVRRYPQLAGVLRQMLPALELMRAPGVDLVAEGEPSAPSLLAGCLGDFRIIREVGRGGMGVVYEAEQISLSRRVALKVLPFAAALDAKQLQRFKNEAQAAAHLHHTNIVPVFGIGCERGVHYYAMQFIDGQTLAAVIGDLRQQAGLDRGGAGTAPGTGAAVAGQLLSGDWVPASHASARLKEASGDGSDPQQTTPYVPPDSPGAYANPLAPDASGAARGKVQTTDTITQATAALATEHSIQTRAYCRTVASLGVQAAEALEHAHQLGVVHRDIKPGNLLVDGRGNLWITDFGLAHMQSQAGLTMTGDLVGTLRYMSPEQALARRVLVDHRTDIYSLGVTLYELLTLQPAFDGRDRQELLRQIAFDEPRPPRRLNKTIPAELETIVGKAMEKYPAERYASGQELADDLRRYLDDKAILAKRPTLVQRSRRWARRHKPVVWAATVSAVVLLIMALLGLTISNSRIAQEKKLTKDALDQAKEQRDEAEANFRKARQAVDDQFTLVSQSKLFDAPGFQSLRKDLLESALKYYQDFLRQRPDDPVLQIEVAAAHLRLYQIHEAIDGSYSPGAIQQLEKGVEIVEQLLREQGRDAELYIRLAGFAKGPPPLHGSYSAPGAQTPALVIIRLFQRIANIWEDFVRDNPAEVGFQSDLSTFYFALQETQASVGQPDEALANIRKALAINEKLARQKPQDPTFRSQLAETHDAFASRLRQSGRPAEVESHLRRALELRQILTDECPRMPDYRAVLADAHHTLGSWWREIGRPKEAEEAYCQGLILQEKLVIDFPKMPAYRHNLASFHEGLGHLYRDAGKTEKAEKAYREALKNWDKLAEDCPTIEKYRVPFSAFCLCLLLAASDREEEADRIYHRVRVFKPESPDGQNYLAWALTACPNPRFGDRKLALDLAKKAVKQAPETGYIWNTFGVAHYRNGNWRDAVVALEKSMQLGGGGDSFDRFFLAMAHWRLGDKEQAHKWFGLGVEFMEKNEQHSLIEELRQELPRFRAEAAELLGIKDQPAAKEKEKPHAKAPSR